MSISNPERPLRRVAKVYVAGSSAELERCEAAIALLEKAGVFVTSTWPNVVRDNGMGNPRDAALAERRHWSTVDLGELRDADLIWMLVPALDAPTRGAWLEVGYATGLGKLVIFSGDTLQSIFCAIGVEFSDDASALEFILGIADTEDTNLAAALRDADQWQITARSLASRLRNLRGIDDPDCARVLDEGAPLPFTQKAEVDRG